MNRQKKGQQEIVGFVLIVVLVVIGLFVFLLVTLRTAPDVGENVVAKNILKAFMGYTTNCAITFEPQYETIGDLLRSCDEGKVCFNLGKDSCEYLEESLEEIIPSMLETEASIRSYRFEYVIREEDIGETGIFFIEGGGNCSSGRVLASQESISSSQKILIARLRLCALD